MVEVLLELVEGYLIARFVFSVVIRILLDGVVSEMHVLTAALDAEVLRTSANVSLTVPPGLPTTPKHPHSNIELPVVVEEGHHVPLDDVGSFLTVIVLAVAVDAL